ncbi:uncharacterized protein METZ01_LOCUS319347, partial [marine metagenome]
MSKLLGTCACILFLLLAYRLNLLKYTGDSFCMTTVFS